MMKFACRVVLLFALACSPLAGQSAVDPAPSNASDRGALLIVGGGSQPESLVRHFIDLAGGPGAARIAVVPMASSVPLESGKDKALQFEEMGAEAFILNVTREQASDPEIVARMRDVTGIWFTGGDQERLVAVLAGTPLLAAMHEARARGAVVGGTSAGAAIMPDSMITGNQIREDTVGYYGDEFPAVARGTIHVVPGFGFLPGAIVDQHFVVRERHNRLMSAVLERPSLIGVGIDESTAIEVTPDGRWIVRGESQVIVYDARDASLTNGGTAPLGAAGVRLHVLPPGSVFDPRTGNATLP